MTTNTQGAAIGRYKIGYYSDDWGIRTSTPSALLDEAGTLVKYADHIAAMQETEATHLRELVAYRLTVENLEREIAAQQPAKAESLRQILTDPENQPNQYGVEFGMSGQQMHFKIGHQLFRLAYEPDDQQEFEFMKRMLIHAFSTFTPDVKMAQQPAPSAAVALSDDLRDRLVAISEAVADQDDRAAQAMLREILKAPQPSLTPQADSQPAPVVDRCTKQQMTAEVLRRMQQQEDGHNKNPFRSLLDRLMRNEGGYSTIEIGQLKYALDGFYGAARAPADSVQEARASHGQAPAPTHEQIAAYLESTGAYVTNDATREAAIAEAIDTDRAKRGQAPDLHPKTSDLVQRFAAALAEKLSAAEKKYGYSDGWASPNWMDECRQHLSAHIAKGDPRDVAAYCAFLWHHGATTASPQAEQQAPTGSEIYVCARKCYNCGHAGINDDHADNAACKSCDWSGPSPEKDHCPDCEKDGTMTAACPMCSCAYIMVADTQVAAPAALNAPQAADSVQEDAARLDWLDQQCEGYGFQDIHEGNRWEISGPYANVRQAIDYERAARKQGEKQ